MGVIKIISSQTGGLNLHLGKTDKFKTVTFFLMFKGKLNEENLTSRALVPQVLIGGSPNLRTRKLLNEKLDEMYGANLSTDIRKKGDYQVIVFRLDIASEEILKTNELLIENALQLLYEIIFQPKLTNDVFDSEIIAQEKNILESNLSSLYDDKMRYATARMIEEMYKNEVYRFSAKGRIEDLKNIGVKEVWQAYKEMIENDRIDLFVIGRFNEKKLKDIAIEKFDILIKRENKAEKHIKYIHPFVKEINYVFENQDLIQGKLHLGYRTYTTFGNSDYAALRVANAIFGGFPSSKLFINVREKKSLAYYILTQLDSHKGLVMVMAGIDSVNYEQVLASIQEEEIALKSGNFSDEDVERAKNILINQLLEVLDTPSGIIELEYHGIIANNIIHANDQIKAIQQVTKKDVINNVKKWKLDTVYFLKER